MIKMLHIWHKALDEWQSVRIFFIDYAKAFDHVDHGVVIKKMTVLGLHAVLVRWFDLLLFHKPQQRVVVGKYMSDWTTLTGAMPPTRITAWAAHVSCTDQ